MVVPGLGVYDSISVRFWSLGCVGFMLTSSKNHENCTHDSLLWYLHKFWPFRDVIVPRTEKAKPLMRSLNLSVACWLSTIAVSWLASALILIYLHLSHKFTSPISYMHLCTLSSLILCLVCNISLWTIQFIT